MTSLAQAGPFIPIIKLLVPLVFLAVLSYLDFKSYNKKSGYLPSILTSSFILLAFIFNENLWLGVFAALVGIVFADLGLWDGIADYKVFVALGLLMNGLWEFGFFVVFTLLIIFGISVWQLGVKRKKQAIYPFIPVLSTAYYLMMLTMGLII